MKRLKHVWPQLVSWQNLLLAYQRARKGKRSRVEVAQFGFDLEYELRLLQNQLLAGDYWPGSYRQIQIYDRKPRTIAVAPFRDRVLQHALMVVIEPHIDRRFITDSYACRVGKGVHRAVDRFQQFAQRYPYLLKLDIASYFPSIDHALLKQKIRHHVADQQVLALLDRIIDSAPDTGVAIADFPGDDLVDRMRPRGIPIGNLTSQFFGNLFLDELDHLIKDHWGEPAYLRYVDDIVLFGDSKQHLWQREQQMREYLVGQRLHIHARKCWVQPSRSGTEYLGYRVWPSRRRLRADNGYTFRRRLVHMARCYAKGTLSLEDMKSRVASWIGHAQHGETLQLRKAIFGSVILSKGNSPTASGRSRGFLEQQTAEPAFGEPQQEHHR